MASFTRSTTIDSDTTVTAQTLHDLIEQCTISFSLSDVAGGGIKAIHGGTGEPSPSAYPLWFCPDPFDPVMRVWDDLRQIWLTFGPDRFEFPMKNAYGATIPKGAVVVASGASEFTLASSPSLNCLGFIQDTCASGAWGKICSCGIGWAFCSSAQSYAPHLSGYGQPLAVDATDLLPGRVGLGYATIEHTSGHDFGRLIAGYVSGVSLHSNDYIDKPVRARFAGPRVASNKW